MLKIGKGSGSFENKSWKGKLEHVGIQLIEKLKGAGFFKTRVGKFSN
jgi:hypothetical protein